MTAPVVDPGVAPPSTDEPEDHFVHVVCIGGCGGSEPPLTTLCGKVGPGNEVPPEVGASCTVCMEMLSSGHLRGLCPRTGGPCTHP